MAEDTRHEARQKTGKARRSSHGKVVLKQQGQRWEWKSDSWRKCRYAQEDLSPSRRKILYELIDLQECRQETGRTRKIGEMDRGHVRLR